VSPIPTLPPSFNVIVVTVPGFRKISLPDGLCNIVVSSPLSDKIPLAVPPESLDE